MAHLWIRDQRAVCSGESISGEWLVWPLTDGALALGTALLLCSRGVDGEQWLVMSAGASGVRLNGAALLTGIRALRDHDELHVDGVGRVFFSTEQLARIEPFPGAERPAFCPRCKQEIDKHYPAVRCPQCNVWYHQSQDLPCWTYSDTCALCAQATHLGAGFRWTPEEL